ncbi:MAG: hypothetical protein H6Q59_755 [Firmicutes bacterium]|nr:hypothetical protein [Bacillota bacterium]
MADMKSGTNKVLIITGGRTESELLKNLIDHEGYSMIIAADHGLAAVDTLNILPDYIVGDFDSVPEELLKKYRDASVPIETFPREKDKTDTQIAIELALAQQAEEIHLIGATGSRLDHTLANIHLLLLPLHSGINACIIDSNNKIYLKQDNFSIHKRFQYGDYVSLLPFSEQVSDLTLKGFRYPLDGILLTAGSSLGISNELLKETAEVEFSGGVLLVIESKD